MTPMPINDISQLTLKTKQISIDSGDFDVVLNFADILKTDEVYINATSFLKKQSEKKNKG